MDRRTFVTTTGLGMGLAGCLNTARNESGAANESADETEPMGSERDPETSTDGTGMGTNETGTNTTESNTERSQPLSPRASHSGV